MMSQTTMRIRLWIVLRWFVALYLTLTGTGILLSEQPSRVGPELQVNTNKTGDQKSPDVAMDVAGNFVVVWQSEGQDGSGAGIFGQRYDASGAPQGAEFQINTTVGNPQRSPSVAYTGSGFVVVWESSAQDGSGYGIFGQRYDSSGTPQGGEFQVNTTVTGNQLRPRVDADGSSRVVVAWASTHPGPYLTVFAQIFEPSGEKVGSEILVTPTLQPREYPDVAMNQTGQFAVAYWNYDQAGETSRIGIRRYGNTGLPQGGELEEYVSSDITPVGVSLGMDGPGNFVVAWSSLGSQPGFLELTARNYDSSGNPEGFHYFLEAQTQHNSKSVSVTRDISGDIVGAWQNFGTDGSGYGIFGRKFNGMGAAQTARFQISSYTPGAQEKPVIAGDRQGRYVVAWESEAQDGSGRGVFAQRLRFCPTLSLSPAAPAVQAICEGQSASITTSASGDRPFAYQWRRNGLDLTNGGPISGATASTLAVNPLAPSHTGAYDCIVSDHCDPAQQSATSMSSLTVVEKPAPVTGLLLQKMGGGSSLTLTWSNAVHAQDYVVLQDPSSSGSFATETGTAPSGGTSLTVPLSGGSLYYLVAGRNPTCGLGPRD